MNSLFKKKNKLLFLTLSVLGILIFNHAYSQEIALDIDGKNYLFESNEDVVRGFIWRLPKIAVTENEKGTLVGDENDSLFYIDDVLGVRTTIGYEFVNNELWRVKLFNEKQYSKMQERIDDLLAYRRILEDRYGEPFDERLIWRDDYEKNHPKNWGWAVYRGHLDIIILWKSEESDVFLSLTSKTPHKPVMSMTFENRDIKNEIMENELKPGLMAPL